MNANDLAALILGELGDSDESIWTTAEMLDLIEESLYDFKIRTLCDWKRRPLNNNVGQATYTIPSAYNFHQLDRAEEDYWVVNATPPRVQMATNGYFETSANRPLALMMQGDGLNTVRKIGVPTSAAGNDSSYVFAGAGATLTLGETAWTNPGNITADDGSNAQCTGANSDYLVGNEFAFDADDGEIQAITVQIQASSDAGASAATFSLVRDGVVLATKVAQIPVTRSTVTVTFTAADWDVVLLGEEINESTFKIYMNYSCLFGPTTVDVDYMKAYFTTSRFIIEFFSFGAAVSEAPTVDIDLPLRYLSYVARRVKSEAYKRDGDGQSLKMAKFWNDWYEDAILMMERRRERMYRRRVSNIGSDGKVPDGARRRDPGSLPAYFPKVE